MTTKKETKASVLEKINEVPEYFAVADEQQDDFDCAFAAVGQNPQLIRYASDRLKDDEELALLALNLDTATWIYISGRLKEKYRGLCPFVIHKPMVTGIPLQMSM